MINGTTTIDGLGPLPVARPASAAELGDLVRRAAADGTALYPFAGGTKLALGQPPIKPGHAIDLCGLDQVLEFAARDMTVTVQAGITLAKLQALLAPENLRLPIDVAQADRATLGGAIATNTSGPRRHGYGTLRDYVIGISAVNDEGHEFKAGGRVVKNVAGYDLCKLLVGSLGTLGIITQATLKLRPLAEEQALVSVGCEASVITAMLDRLHGSRTRLVSVDLLNRPAAATIFGHAQLAAPSADWTLLIGFEGNAEAVKWQVQQLIKEVGATCSLELRVAFTAQPLGNALVEWSAWPEAVVSFKANLLPSAVAGFCHAADGASPRPSLCAHAGNGIVIGQWADGLTAEQAASILNSWRQSAAKYQGSVVVQRCPSAWKPVLSVWGPAPPSAWLMRAVKEQFDPRRIFNPGRFVDGI